MKKPKYYWFTLLLFIFCLILMSNLGFADDTCTFMATPDEDQSPNIVIMLDNGVGMEQIQWHSDYDNAMDYKPGVGSVFSNGRGYGLIYNDVEVKKRTTRTYYLVPVLADLTLGRWDDALSLPSGSGTTTWTINGKSVSLPLDPLKHEVDGVIDGVDDFRYSTNYLNWIFYSGNYTGDGSDLSDMSRFYYAKKAIMTVAKLSANQVKFGVYNFTANAEGGSNVQPLGLVVETPLAPIPQDNILQSNFVNVLNNMGTVTYSPLAEGLASVGGYYASPSSRVVDSYCQNNFVIVVSPGVSSEDQNGIAMGYFPEKKDFEDYDGDNEAEGIGEGKIKEGSTIYTIPTELNGSTFLDDMAHYLYTHDVIDYQLGFQRVITYTIGFMGSQASHLFLINTSNNGNGNPNLYDTTDPEYGKYHFFAESPTDLATVLLKAINDIILRSHTFVGPIVPVSRTYSNNTIYMSFFKPDTGNFWEGNLAKFALSNDNEIIDSLGNPATWANGALKESAVPYWATKDWADSTKSNYIHNSQRNIYTYLGFSFDFNSPSNEFISGNTFIASEVLGNPTHTTQEIINYVRGADVFDEDADGDTSENRAVITGDIFHSAPLVVQYDSSTSVIYFGANDGMLHAVSDADGSEMWAFVPPDQLHRLKDIAEGVGHQYFVDSSPKAYIEDVDGDGVIEPSDGDKVILVCGEGRGGTSYFALDVTIPSEPKFLWRINQNDDAAAGTAPNAARPDVIIPELGESWATPRFGRVKTSAEDTTGTPVFFIGGGYSSTDSVGKAVVAINPLTGAVVKTFKNDGVNITDMNYSIPSSVLVVDTDGNGLVDKVYVGDLGSQMWRFGRFTDSDENPLVFPDSDENINNWKAQVMFLSDSTHNRKFFYPPGVTLEKRYDLVFTGTGNRWDACNPNSSDRIYALKDIHASATLQETDLVDVTDPTKTPPDINSQTGDVDDNGKVDQGWYLRLENGEKVLDEVVVFYKVLYVTTFLPTDDSCLADGVAKLYALKYKTGAAGLISDSELTRSVGIGGGIPSKPVVVITQTGAKLLVSIGNSNPEAESESLGVGILAKEVQFPTMNFFYKYWMEL